MLEQALKYARLGFHVFPLSENSKIPKSKSSGFKDATNNEIEIRKLWMENPRSNIGIRTGFGYKVFCLDVDKKNGKDGFQWLKNCEELPNTIAQITPSGGHQYLFEMPEEDIPSSADKLFDGIDIRANGGYFVAPPSKISYGKYEWFSDQAPGEIELAKIPDWLLEECRKNINIENIEDEENTKSILPITSIIEKYNLKLKKNGNIYTGAHPIHGSSNGHNFKIDANKNVWACYRHRKNNGNPVGGGSLQLIALLEGILDCHECIPGALTGDRYNRVLSIVEDKFGLSPDKFKKEDAKEIIDELNKINNQLKKSEIIEQIKTLAPRMAKLKQADYLTVCLVAKEAFKLNVSDLKIIKLTVGGLRKKASKIVMDTDEMGNPTPTDKNALLIMDEDENLAGVFRKDLFSGMINVMAGDRWCLSDKKFPRTLKNDDIFQIKRYIIDKYGLQYKQTAIDEAITSSAVKNNYDSLNDYLNGLKWDGVPRVDNWMVEACGVKDNEYHKWVGKLFLISAVKRAFNPGIKYDHVIVFAGAQGSLKSTMIEELAGEERYSCMKLDEKDKEIIQKMQGRWIIELGEGVPLRKKDMNELKAFLTTRKNHERFAYTKYVETYARRSIFVMTINPDAMGYLPDPTGNRRFLPVQIEKKIDIKYIKENRDQLFAEAIELHKKGFRIHIDEDNEDDNKVLEILKQEHKKAETVDDWQHSILNWFLTGTIRHRNREKNIVEVIYEPIPEVGLCLDIFTTVFRGDPLNYSPQIQGRRIGAILNKLGLKSKSIRVGNEITTKFLFKEFADEIKKEDKETAINEAENLTKEKQEVEWEE